jgi:hypothetical protein
MNQVITASRLRDGAVVFLGPKLQWVERLAEAEVFGAVETSTEALKAAQKDEAENVVLDIYAIDVADRHGAWVPVKLREAIRAQGPTVHPEHGKPLGTARNG